MKDGAWTCFVTQIARYLVKVSKGFPLAYIANMMSERSSDQ